MKNGDGVLSVVYRRFQNPSGGSVVKKSAPLHVLIRMAIHPWTIRVFAAEKITKALPRANWYQIEKAKHSRDNSVEMAIYPPGLPGEFDLCEELRRVQVRHLLDKVGLAVCKWFEKN